MSARIRRIFSKLSELRIFFQCFVQPLKRLTIGGIANQLRMFWSVHNRFNSLSIFRNVVLLMPPRLVARVSF